MNAIEFITKQHEKIKKTFKELKDADRPETQKKIFSELSAFLVKHETTEEKVLYPKLKSLKNEKIDKIIDHLITEEKAASKAIHEIKKIDDFDKWKEKVLKLNKDVEHHASEEENKLFPEISKHCDKSELEEIGKEMYAFFNKA